jgi:surface polysaccharide O-acyltransferase-like enzyme
MNSLKTDKLYELDYIRVMACLAVMILHITATGVTGYINGSFPQIVMLTINLGLKFVTPLFIFLSGVTSFYNYKKQEFEYMPYVARRLSKVLLAYLVWCIIYYAAFIKFGYTTFDIWAFIEGVFLGTLSYHLYFVIIIVQLYIVGPIFYKLLKNSNKKIIVLIVSAIISVLCAEYIRFENSDRLFLKYMFFYILGIYVSLEYDRYISWIIKNKILISIGYITLLIPYILVSYYNLSIYISVWYAFSTCSIFFVYYVGLIMKRNLYKIFGYIKVFSQSSYQMYLMHPFILSLMIIFTENNGILSVTMRLIIYSVVVIPATIIVSVIFTAIINKIKKNKKAALAA